MNHQDPGRDREEDRGAVEVEGHLLGTRQSATDGDDQCQDHRDHEEQVADIGGCRNAEDPEGRLAVPAQLADEPGGRAQRDETAKPALDPAGAIGSASGQRRGQEAGDRPVGVLPEDHLAARVDRGQDHQEHENRKAQDEESADGGRLDHGAKARHDGRQARSSGIRVPSTGGSGQVGRTDLGGEVVRVCGHCHHPTIRTSAATLGECPIRMSGLVPIGRVHEGSRWARAARAVRPGDDGRIV